VGSSAESVSTIATCRRGVSVESGEASPSQSQWKPVVVSFGAPRVHYAVCWSLDFNVNPMCSVIGQWEEDFSPARYDYLTLRNEEEKRVKTLRILDEIWIPHSHTAEACQEFVDRIEKFLDRHPNLTVKIYDDILRDYR